MSDVISVFASNVDNAASEDVETRRLLRSLKCPHCHLFFNQSSRQPRRLPGCEHPTCHACVFTTLMRSRTQLICHCGVITESDTIDTAAFPLHVTMQNVVGFFMPNDGEISNLDMPRILRTIRSELINNPTFRRSPASVSTGSLPSRSSGASVPRLSNSQLSIRASTSSVDLPESAVSPWGAGDGVTSGDRRPDDRSSGRGRDEALRVHLRALLGRLDDGRQATSSHSTHDNSSASRPWMGSDGSQRPYDGRARLGRTSGPSTSQPMNPRSPPIFDDELVRGLDQPWCTWQNRLHAEGMGSGVGLSRSTESQVRPNRASTSAGSSSANAGGDYVPPMPPFDGESPCLLQCERRFAQELAESSSLRAPSPPRSPTLARDTARPGQGTGAENSSHEASAAVNMPRTFEVAGGSDPAPGGADCPSDDTSRSSSPELPHNLSFSFLEREWAANNLSSLFADNPPRTRGRGNFSSSALGGAYAVFTADDFRAFERRNRPPSPDVSPVRSTSRERITGDFEQGFVVRYVNELRRRAALARDLDRDGPIRRTLGGSRIPRRRGTEEEVEFEEYDPAAYQNDYEDRVPFDDFIRSLENWRDRSPVRMPPLEEFTSPVPVLSETRKDDQCVVCQSGLVEPSPYPSDPPATDDDGKVVIRFRCAHMLHRNCAMSMAAAFCSPTSVVRPIGPMQCPLCKRNLY